jgi:hypothetical protein
VFYTKEGVLTLIKGFRSSSSVKSGERRSRKISCLSSVGVNGAERGAGQTSQSQENRSTGLIGILVMGGERCEGRKTFNLSVDWYTILLLQCSSGSIAQTFLSRERVGAMTSYQSNDENVFHYLWVRVLKIVNTNNYL